MKDWLTVIIVLLIVGIVLDGVRRMRLARRENISLSKNAKKADQDREVPVSSSEFPSGGARVAGYRDEKDASDLNDSVRKNFETKRTTIGAPQRIPEQVSLNLEESVPMLMDSVDDVESESEDIDEVEYKDPREPEIGSLEDLQEDDSPIAAQDTPSTESAVNPTTEKVPEQPAEADQPDYQEPEEVLIMNVMSKAGERFDGSDLLEALMQEGLKFGDMDIFHRHKDNDGDAPILFSLANMVVPGTFNLAEMENFETPGVSIFLSLPVAGESIAAYNDMAKTARNLADTLGGELKDENRSVMTNQTIEHGRQRVIEFERKKKLARV